MKGLGWLAPFSPWSLNPTIDRWAANPTAGPQITISTESPIIDWWIDAVAVTLWQFLCAKVQITKINSVKCMLINWYVSYWKYTVMYGNANQIEAMKSYEEISGERKERWMQPIKAGQIRDLERHAIWIDKRRHFNSRRRKWMQDEYLRWNSDRLIYLQYCHVLLHYAK